MIKTRRDEIVECTTCKKKFLKSFKQTEQVPERNFCSRRCNIIYQNSKRNIKHKKKIVSCSVCNDQIEISIFSSIKECNKCKCSKKRKSKYISHEHVSQCKICKKEIIVKSTKQYCDECRKVAHHNGGVKSSQLQSRRSKNEMYFYELCKNTFTNVTNNEQFFIDKNGNKWDADIILHDQKIAILWNGLRHYKKLTKRHSVKQVQSRDIIKMKLIKDSGYQYYVIKDLGKFNKKFVELKFNEFKSSL